MNNIIFLFSLPRSGSTLLQRMLTSHENIASVSEPWLLLPQVYAARREGVLAEYSHHLAYVGYADFINSLPDKEEDYRRAVHDFVWQLYARQCRNQETYFLDKTPPYFLIIHEIEQIFPEAKFIFLFRNPVQILSSVIQSRWKGRLYGLFAPFHMLRNGPGLLASGYQKLKSKAFAIHYDQLVTAPEPSVRALCDYLELDYQAEQMQQFHSQNLGGSLGDQVGSQQYQQVTEDPLQKWKSVLNTPLRKRLVLKYLRSLDKEVLDVLGYPKETLLTEIRQLETRWRYTCRDGLDLIAAYLALKLHLNLFLDPRMRWSKHKYLS